MWPSIVLMQVLKVRIIFQEKGPSTPCPRVTGVFFQHLVLVSLVFFSTPCPGVTGVSKKKVEWVECLMYERQYNHCSACLDLDSGQDTTSCRTFANNWLHIRTHVRFCCWQDCCRTGCFSAWTPWGWWDRWATRRGAPSPQPAGPSWPACWCSSTCSLAQVWGLFVRPVASSGLDVSLWRGWLRHRWKMALTDDRGRRSTGKLPFHSPPPLSNPSGAKWMWAGTRF